MKSVFDSATRNELIARINSLTPESKALWGKMDVAQMINHCTIAEDMYSGAVEVKRVFIGRLIGKFILKQALKDETPFRKNSPTSPTLLKPTYTGNLEAQKAEWIKRVKQYENYTNSAFVHPFFGPLNKEQIGQLDYKHIDHHLRQFGA